MAKPRFCARCGKPVDGRQSNVGGQQKYCSDVCEHIDKFGLDQIPLPLPSIIGATIPLAVVPPPHTPRLTRG